MARSRASEEAYAAEYNGSIDKLKTVRIKRSRTIGKLIRACDYLWLTRSDRNARAFFEAMELISKARLSL